MNGKSTCNALKQIRKEIADANGIAYSIDECNYMGECSGTCPKCESELRYIENELMKRQALGKTVVLAGLATSLTVFSGFSCGVGRQIEGDVARQPQDTIEDSHVCQPSDTTGADDSYWLEGDVAMPIENADSTQQQE